MKEGTAEPALLLVSQRHANTLSKHINDVMENVAAIKLKKMVSTKNNFLVFGVAGKTARN